jgi:GNAT superfamily N-acetyltransferase
MTELTVRVLGESDWSLYREVRLSALKESPRSFTASLDEEAGQDEQWWRRSRRLLAEVDQEPQGTISLGTYPDKAASGEVFGLYVFPQVRGHGVSSRLVEAAEALAIEDGFQQLFYWVGVDNPRAIGFATSFGFRLTGARRPSHATNLDLGDEEIAMVLPLMNDGSSVPNPTSGHAAPQEGPLE